MDFFSFRGAISGHFSYFLEVSKILLKVPFSNENQTKMSTTETYIKFKAKGAFVKAQ